MQVRVGVRNIPVHAKAARTTADARVEIKLAMNDRAERLRRDIKQARGDSLRGVSVENHDEKPTARYQRWSLVARGRVCRTVEYTVFQVCDANLQNTAPAGTRTLLGAHTPPNPG